MKKIIATFTAAVLLFQTVTAQTELITVEENNLKGPVKSVETDVNWLKQKFGEWEKSSPYYKESMVFNKAGNLSSSSKEEGRFKADYAFRYDKSDRLSQKTNEFGVEKDMKEYSWKYKYDAQGREIEENMYDEKGELSWKKKVQYNKDNQVKESIYYDWDGRVSVRYEYSYSSTGKLKSETKYNSSDEIILQTTNDYDNEGNRIRQESSEKTYKGTTIKTTYRWTYQSGRKTTESRLVINNGKEARSQNEFDDAGNVVLHSETGIVQHIAYTFDSYGNWITATTTWTSSNGEEVAYRKDRTIRYY